MSNARAVRVWQSRPISVPRAPSLTMERVRGEGKSHCDNVQRRKVVPDGESQTHHPV